MPQAKAWSHAMSTNTVTRSPARFGFRWLGAAMVLAVCSALIVGWASLLRRTSGTAESASAAEPISGGVEGGI
jgi:hypothetical protein